MLSVKFGLAFANGRQLVLRRRKRTAHLSGTHFAFQHIGSRASKLLVDMRVLGRDFLESPPIGLSFEVRSADAGLERGNYLARPMQLRPQLIGQQRELLHISAFDRTCL